MFSRLYLTQYKIQHKIYNIAHSNYKTMKMTNLK